MSKSKKFVALFLAFALVLSMVALGGCTKDTGDGTDTTDGGTEARVIKSTDDLKEGDIIECFTMKEIARK